MQPGGDFGVDLWTDTRHFVGDEGYGRNEAMTRDEEQTVLLIARHHLGPGVNLDSKFDTDAIDARIDTLLALEERFAMKVPDWNSIHTVGDLVSAVRSAVDAK